jgi:hypothetical protein
MSYSFKLSRRIARLRLPVLVALASSFAACDGNNSLSPDVLDPQSPAAPTTLAGGDESVDTLAVSTTMASATYGGIPFGAFAQPTTMYGSTYTGGKVTVGPATIKSTLAAIKARGGRVVLMMAGSEVYYRDAAGHFSFTKWKQRIDRFRGVNFDSYIKDGTIIGHYIIDEPQDPTNWNGRPITPATVDQMGQYSKARWPSMVTIVRTAPKFFPSHPKYIDAAWAQYLSRMGSVSDYIRKNVADAQTRRMQLVVGLNVIGGGQPNLTPMNATEIKTFGSALLSSSYPCAFISWQYRSTYFSSSSIKDAMRTLSSKAKSRGSKSCRAG